uniref:Pectinesterase inhibitor domain-containing protein n=1 Tax=Kalanchoe fedtschenkoi TaxID=63787 RepID=A0A7N0TKR2_KALFE
MDKNPTTLFLLFILFLAFSSIPRVDSECVKRNFKYPIPSGKPVVTSSSATAQQPSPSSSSSSSSSSSKEEKISSSSSSSETSSSGSASVSGSSSGADDSPDAEPQSKSLFGGMLKQVLNHIDANSPILNIPRANVEDPEIKKMCDKTDYPDLCQSTVAHFMDGRNDPVSMLDMVIKACVQYTHLAMAGAKKLSASPAFGRIKSRFNDIAEYYADALENLQDAANAIKVKDMATVNINLSAALDDFGAYEDDWGETSPMADFDTKLTHMASNCLAIATLVKFH